MLYQTIRKAKIQSTSGHPKPFIVFRSAKLTPVSGDTKFQPGDTVQIWFDTDIKDIDTKWVIRSDKSDPGEIWSWLGPVIVLAYFFRATSLLTEVCIYTKIMNTTFKNKAAIFRIIPRNMFAAQYEEAFEAVENDELDLEIEEPFTYGEVKFPGQGKRGCLVMSSTKKPGWFYDDFDGWNRVPSGETFIEVTSTVQPVASTGKPRAARLNPCGPEVVNHL